MAFCLLEKSPFRLCYNPAVKKRSSRSAKGGTARTERAPRPRPRKAPWPSRSPASCSSSSPSSPSSASSATIPKTPRSPTSLPRAITSAISREAPGPISPSPSSGPWAWPRSSCLSSWAMPLCGPSCGAPPRTFSSGWARSRSACSSSARCSRSSSNPSRSAAARCRPAASSASSC